MAKLKDTQSAVSILECQLCNTSKKELAMTRMVHCVKLGKEAPAMKFAPLPNELGKRIFDNVSQEAWDAWTRHQTMLINENRLSLADPRARQYLAQQMENYFSGDGADAVQGYVPQD